MDILISANRNINTAKSLEKGAEGNLPADKKGPHHLGQVVVWVIYTYTNLLYIH